VEFEELRAEIKALEEEVGTKDTKTGLTLKR